MALPASQSKSDWFHLYCLCDTADSPCNCLGLKRAADLERRSFVNWFGWSGQVASSNQYCRKVCWVRPDRTWLRAQSSCFCRTEASVSSQQPELARRCAEWRRPGYPRPPEAHHPSCYTASRSRGHPRCHSVNICSLCPISVCQVQNNYFCAWAAHSIAVSCNATSPALWNSLISFCRMFWGLRIVHLERLCFSPSQCAIES